VTLPLAGIQQEIAVSSAPTEVNADASHDLDAVTVDQAMLGGLPVLDRDYLATISRFLDAGSMGTSGVTAVVNGMEVSGLKRPQGHTRTRRRAARREVRRQRLRMRAHPLGRQVAAFGRRTPVC
jgi:hypothetical protein